MAIFKSWRDLGSQAKTTIGPPLQRYLKSGVHKRGMGWMRMSMGIESGFKQNLTNAFGAGIGKGSRLSGIGSLAWRGVAAAWFLGDVAKGYHREGVWGAAKAGIGFAAENYLFGAVLGSAALPVGLAAAGVTGYAALRKFKIDTGRQYALNLRRTTFGPGSVEDQYGTVATMRRRSVDALMSSRIGGNMGLGNESLRAYTPYFR